MKPTVTQLQDTALLAEINITPFTDVLLVLLIIFMVLAALLTPPGFERKWSTACKTAPGIVFRSLSVVIDRAGHFNIDGRWVSRAQLYATMAAIGSRDSRAHVSLLADLVAPYGSALIVLDAAKLAGLKDVNFVTK